MCDCSVQIATQFHSAHFSVRCKWLNHAISAQQIHFYSFSKNRISPNQVENRILYNSIDQQWEQNIINDLPLSVLDCSRLSCLMMIRALQKWNMLGWPCYVIQIPFEPQQHVKREEHIWLFNATYGRWWMGKLSLDVFFFIYSAWNSLSWKTQRLISPPGYPDTVAVYRPDTHCFVAVVVLLQAASSAQVL